MLVQSENGKLRAALVANLKSAVTASFLMLPESFSEEDLFLQIAGLSYAGKYFLNYEILLIIHLTACFVKVFFHIRCYSDIGRYKGNTVACLKHGIL